MTRDYLKESDQVKILLYSEESLPEDLKKPALKSHRYGEGEPVLFVGRPQVNFCDTIHDGHRVASPALEAEIMRALVEQTGNSYAIIRAARDATSFENYLAMGKKESIRLQKTE